MLSNVHQCRVDCEKVSSIGYQKKIVVVHLRGDYALAVDTGACLVDVDYNWTGINQQIAVCNSLDSINERGYYFPDLVDANVEL
ncbi:MAG: hypothetical protein ACP6IU_10140 [Candidatus Asgardarchaeia archaeon]